MKKSEIFLFIIIAGVFVFLSSAFKGFLQDDAYIFARYAQNIADGNGFVYNKGEYTEGATSFLWTIIAAISALFGANIPHFLKVASLISSVLWLSAFFLVCKQWLIKPFQWAIPVILFAFFPAFLLWSQGGLEVSFFGFLLTIGFYLVEEWHQKGKNVHLISLSLVAVLLILTRPEGLPVAIVFAAYLFFYPNPEKKNLFYKIYLPTVVFAFAAFMLFRYFYFQDFVPNTYYAKGGGGWYLRRLGLGKLNVFMQTHWNWIILSAAFPVFIIKSRIRFIIAIVPIWMAYFINSGGDILPEHRLLLPAVPFMFLGTFFFIFYLSEIGFGTKIRKIFFGSIIGLISVLFVVKYYLYYKENLRSYTDVISALERAHGGTGKYLNAYMNDSDVAILTDAGMTALYAQDKYIVDWLGLCDKRVSKIFYETGYNAWAMSYCYDDVERNRRKNACSDAMNKYFDELNPRYVVLNIYAKENNEEMLKMVDFYQNTPDTLSDFVISRISFDGYFNVFTKENRARNYKPVSVIPFNPYFWMIIIEKPIKQ